MELREQVDTLVTVAHVRLAESGARSPDARTVDAEIDSLELSVLWYTEGTGDEDLKVHFFQRYSADDAQEPTLVLLQKQTVAELGEARKELQTLLAQFKEAAATQTDLLSLNETEFKRVLALDSAHYNLSAQSFTAVWAVLDFLQRFMVDPVLANDPQHKPDPHAESVRQRRDARVAGLQMAERMDEQFQSPQPIQMVLISPPGEG